jgi:membrane-associated phospholipid phosphatase
MTMITRMSIARLLATGALAAGALAGCRNAQALKTDRQDAEPLHEAVDALNGVIVYDIFSPPQASRVYAYASVAAYEVLQQRDSAHRSLAGQLAGLTPVPAAPPDSEYYAPLASVHAFMTVGKALTFSQDRMDSLRTAMDERIRGAGVPDAVYRRSIAYGDTVAAHVLAWSKKDVFLQTRGMSKFTVTQEPGRWIPTPPMYADAVEPNWGRLRPFAMDSSSQFRPEAAYAFDTTPASHFFREAREVYDVSKRLTEDNKETVLFWDDNPYVMHVQGHTMYATKKRTPGGHWMAIAAIAARKSGADMMKTAEAYALTSLALADGFIACWDAKFHSNLIRPESVINRHIDDRWQPMLQTPPFPEYPSGHSTISAAAATVLTRLFGERFAFTDSSQVAFGLPVRSFPSFEAAAKEAGMSRLYGGIHFRHGVEAGLTQGRAVGAQLLARARTRAEPTVAQAGAPAGTTTAARDTTKGRGAAAPAKSAGGR